VNGVVADERSEVGARMAGGVDELVRGNVDVMKDRFVKPLEEDETGRRRGERDGRAEDRGLDDEVRSRSC